MASEMIFKNLGERLLLPRVMQANGVVHAEAGANNITTATTGTAIVFNTPAIDNGRYWDGVNTDKFYCRDIGLYIATLNVLIDFGVNDPSSGNIIVYLYDSYSAVNWTAWHSVNVADSAAWNDIAFNMAGGQYIGAVNAYFQVLVDNGTDQNFDLYAKMTVTRIV